MGVFFISVLLEIRRGDPCGQQPRPSSPAEGRERKERNAPHSDAPPRAAPEIFNGRAEQVLSLSLSGRVVSVCGPITDHHRPDESTVGVGTPGSQFLRPLNKRSDPSAISFPWAAPHPGCLPGLGRLQGERDTRVMLASWTAWPGQGAGWLARRPLSPAWPTMMLLRPLFR